MEADNMSPLPLRNDIASNLEKLDCHQHQNN